MASNNVESELRRSKPDLTSVKNGQSAMSLALQGLSTRPPLQSEDLWTPDASPNASDADVTNHSRSQSKQYLTDVQSRSTTAIPSDGSDIEIPFNETPSQKTTGARRKSVQIVFEESGNKGGYTVTTEDSEFREILRSGLQQTGTFRGRSKNRPRDLVFTRQFTTFDRQNASAAQSPFHGFFTLFWISMALLLIRIAAGNYKTKGSVFGEAEILHLMIDRDLFVMLTTDASMYAATSFGFILHKAISKNYLTWDGSGWVVQSMWQIFYTAAVIWVTFWRDWPWTHSVFIVLHVFVLLMKQHAYSFYNGYCKYGIDLFVTIN